MYRIASLNGLCRAPLGIFVASAVHFLSACNPSLNWRETRIADTDLTAMMPCKPAHHQRSVPLAGLTVTLHMTACDADGASFAIAHATIPDASAAPQVLAQWRKTTLANMAATSVTDVAESPLPASSLAASSSPLSAANLSPLPGSLRATAQGKRGDGSPVHLQGVWFARGPQVFHAAVYAPIVTPDMTDTYFSGLKFQ